MLYCCTLQMKQGHDIVPFEMYNVVVALVCERNIGQAIL